MTQDNLNTYKAAQQELRSLLQLGRGKDEGDAPYYLLRQWESLSDWLVSTTGSIDNIRQLEDAIVHAEEVSHVNII